MAISPKTSFSSLHRLAKFASSMPDEKKFRLSCPLSLTKISYKYFIKNPPIVR